MANFISDLKSRFNRGDIHLQLIYINVGIFVVATLISVFLMLFRWDAVSWLQYLELPAEVSRFCIQPWSLFSYMFLHIGALHLLFNMLWLYWFGQLFLSCYSARHFRGLYIWGGLLGGLSYMLAFNIFPYFSDSVNGSFLLGASASVLAIVVATAVRAPEYRVNLMLIGAVKLKYVALFVVLMDLLFVTSGNGGGHIAHLGGALAGWWFAWSLLKGMDVTGWINWVFDKLSKIFSFKVSPSKTRMKVRKGGRASDYDYNARKKQQSEEIDRILDKLKKSGYASLTTEEKKRLFDASRK